MQAKRMCEVRCQSEKHHETYSDCRRRFSLDTCNVYVIRAGEQAILIDFGTGSVLEHLTDIGVKKVAWVLFTHHHREQVQG